MKSKYKMEAYRMSEDMKRTKNLAANITITEIIFGTLLGVGSIFLMWISTTLLIHLYKSLY